MYGLSSTHHQAINPNPTPLPARPLPTQTAKLYHLISFYFISSLPTILLSFFFLPFPATTTTEKKQAVLHQMLCSCVILLIEMKMQWMIQVMFPNSQMPLSNIIAGYDCKITCMRVHLGCQQVKGGERQREFGSWVHGLDLKHATSY